MKYYLDTEFIEGTQKTFFGKTKPTIDLISIGLVSEDDREYYTISKDFNLKEAWNRWDGEYHEQSAYEKYHQFPLRKKYWIRDNVLRPIFYDFVGKDIDFHDCDKLFTFKNFKKYLKKYGKNNGLIAQEIIEFTFIDSSEILKNGIEFYTYYGDYDWVVFCWLFGKMNNLPKGFPKYSKDLKQIFDDKQKLWSYFSEECRSKICKSLNLFSNEIDLKQLSNYPKQKGEHNALADAKWNKELHNFLTNLK